VSLVYKREGSDYWYFNLNAETGRRRLSTGVKDKREAERIAAEKIRITRDAEMFGILPEVTVEDALFLHFLPLKLRLRSYAGVKRSAELLAGRVKGVKGLGGKTKFHRINSLMLDNYRAEREAMGAAPNTIDREIAALSACYHKLRTAFRMPVSLDFPMERVKGRSRFLTDDEVIALLDRLDPLRPLHQKGTDYLMDPLAHSQLQRVANHDLVVLLLDTGARLNEIAMLPWRSVDTVGFQWVRLYRSKVQNESILALTARASAMMRRRSESRAKSPFVFPADNAEINSGKQSRSTKGIRKAMEDIGINSPSNVALYGRRDVRSLRDTHATKLRALGLDLGQIQVLLGHSSPVMTQKYAHAVVHDASLRAVAALDQASITTTYRETMHDQTL
jgi:integrase